MSDVRLLGSHYELGEFLGRGAMGEVFVATDLATGQKLAAKVLRAEHADDDEVTARFLQERKLLRGLVHPNIVRVHELILDRDDIAIVMDLVDGSDARRHQQAAGRFTPYEAARICADVLAALAMAHAMDPPIQHRDVKPDNILLGRGSPASVYLSDFGVARLAEAGTSVRLTTGIGTADYMAPEMSGRTAGSPADVYALGITLYEMLAGHTPFGRDTYAAVGVRHVMCRPPRLTGAPAQLAEFVDSLLVKTPESRPSAATAEARLRALLPALRSLPLLPESPAPTEWEPVGSGPGVAAHPSARQALDSADQQALGTRIRASGPRPSPLPVANTAGLATARTDGASDQSALSTNLVAAATKESDREAAKPTIQAKDAVPSGAKNRRTALIVAACVAVLMAIVIGAYELVGGNSGANGDRSQAESATEADVVESALLPTDFGLISESRSGSWDPDSRQLTITVTVSRPAGLPIAGSFLEVVPATSAGMPCPSGDLDWKGWGGTQASGVVPSSDCGWQVTPPKGKFVSDSTQPFKYTIPFRSERADAKDRIYNYLVGQSQSLKEALSHVSSTSDSYAVQRILGVYMDTPTDAIAGQNLAIQVLPEWASPNDSGPDNLHPLYDAHGPVETELSKLGLGIQFDTSECPGATLEPFQQIMVASYTDGCVITANVGALKASSSRFAVEAPR